MCLFFFCLENRLKRFSFHYRHKFFGSRCKYALQETQGKKTNSLNSSNKTRTQRQGQMPNINGHKSGKEEDGKRLKIE